MSSSFLSLTDRLDDGDLLLDKRTGKRSRFVNKDDKLPSDIFRWHNCGKHKWRYSGNWKCLCTGERHPILNSSSTIKAHGLCNFTNYLQAIIVLCLHNNINSDIMRTHEKYSYWCCICKGAWVGRYSCHESGEIYFGSWRMSGNLPGRYIYLGNDWTEDVNWNSKIKCTLNCGVYEEFTLLYLSICNKLPFLYIRFFAFPLEATISYKLHYSYIYKVNSATSCLHVSF